MFTDVPGDAHIALTPQSSDLAEISLWRTVFPEHGIEGLVLKAVPVKPVETSGYLRGLW
jgi:hypothetical protein